MPKHCFSRPFFSMTLWAPLLTLAACTGAKRSATDTADKPFTIVESTYTNWQSGRANGGSGTDYRFLAVIHSNEPLQFDSVWLRQQGQTLALTAARAKGPVTNQPFRFAKGDTIALLASTTKSMATTGAKATENDAVLWYRVGGRQATEAVATLVNQETPLQPRN